jgi:hypothetical protein
MRRNRVKLFFIALTGFFLTCFGAAKAVSPMVSVPASPPKDEKPTLPPNDIFEVFNRETVHRFLPSNRNLFGMSRMPRISYQQRTVIDWKGTKTTILISPIPRTDYDWQGRPYLDDTPRISRYKPETDGEKQAVRALEKDGWKFGIYLFGRRVDVYITRVGSDSHKESLFLRYPLNEPLSVTSHTQARHLMKPEKLIPQVNDAFDAFFAGKERYDFTLDNRAFVAIPVRAQTSCLNCHRGPVVTRVLGDDPKKPKLQYRERRVGDTIGILVYSFEKR